jgi:hypothetical protein
MAIIRDTEMPTIGVEQGMVPPRLTPHPSPGNNNEIFSERNPLPVPVTDASINEELNLMRNLRDSQNDLSAAGSVIKNLSGTKNTVIYFSQSNIKLNTDNFNITAPSPVNSTKYDRIDNMIILTEEELQDNFNVEDGRVDNTPQSSGIMYPGLSPKTSDLFWMNDVGGKGVLYIISSVSPIATLDFTGFRIEFQRNPDQLSPEEMTNLIRDYFVFKFENVGTDRVTILQHSVANLYDAVTTLYQNVTDEFISRFFDINRNIIRLKHTTTLNNDKESNFVILGQENKFKCCDNDILPQMSREIFDPYVMEFISQTFSEEKLQYNGYSIFPMNPIWIGEEFKKTYKNSIYNAFSHRKPGIIKYYYHYPILFNASTIRDLAFENWYYFDLISNEDPRCINIFPNGFIARIKGNTLYDEKYDDKSLIKYNVFIKFANIKDYIVSEKDIEPFMTDIDLMEDIEFYGIAPLLLYICYQFRQTVNKRVQ